MVSSRAIVADTDKTLSPLKRNYMYKVKESFRNYMYKAKESFLTYEAELVLYLAMLENSALPMG